MERLEKVLWKGRLEHIASTFEDEPLLQTSFHFVKITTYNDCKEDEKRKEEKKKEGTYKKPYPSQTGSLSDYNWPEDLDPSSVLVKEELRCRGGNCTTTGTKK